MTDGKWMSGTGTHGGGRPVSRRDFLSPLAIIAGLILIVLTAAIHFAVHTFDKGSELREQTLARNGIAQRINEVALLVVPQTDWDDAVTNLDNGFDQDWSRTNIGTFLKQTDGFDRSFVLDGNDRLLEGYVSGKPVAPDAYRSVDALAQGLIRSVRAQERQRGPFRITRHDEMVSKPIQASGLKMVEGRLEVMTATLVQPDFGTALPAGPRAPVVITTMPVDPAFLGLFANRYLLKDLHVLPPGMAKQDHETAIPALDEERRVLGSFVWTPLNPGYSMLRDLLPPILGIGLALMLIAFFQFRRIYRLAGQLVARRDHALEAAISATTVELPDRERFVEQLGFEISCTDEGHGLAVQCVRIVVDGALAGAGAGALTAAQHDAIVTIAGQRLARVLRQEALIARISPDSFGILSVGIDEAQAHALEKRMASALSEPLLVETVQATLAPRIATTIVTDSHGWAEVVLAETEEMTTD